MLGHSFDMIYYICIFILSMVSVNILTNNYKLQKISIRINRITYAIQSQRIIHNATNNYMIIKNK